ncbi:MAG: alpha/beta fold hydrolase, partial [Frankiaceae bacterium]
MVRRGGAASALRFVDVGGHRLEYADGPAAVPGRPALVFLHEGLGCVAMWRGFPGLVATRTGCRAVVYSRRGYGGSDPFDASRTPRYLHDEALDVLPALRRALGLDRVVLV